MDHDDDRLDFKFDGPEDRVPVDRRLGRISMAGVAQEDGS